MINPFYRIAGWQALVPGLIFIVFMGLIGSYSNLIFDGIIDMHFVSELTLLHSFTVLAIDLVSIVLVMCLAGLFISKSFRFIDILGTMTLSKAPFLLLAVAGLFTKAPDMSHVMTNPYSMFSSPSFIFILVLSLPVIIWSVALMYNALKVSCDVKGSKLTVSFIIAVLVAEIISKILIIRFM
jgi:hypothetical protein